MVGAPGISVIVVNWNTRALLRGCLESLFADPDRPALEVVVVDNGSTDGSCEMLAGHFPQVALIRNRSNLGFAAANNQAIAATDRELVLLLNSDTRVAPGALARLAGFLSENPGAGAVAPLLTHPQDRFRVLYCGNQPSLRALFNHYFFLSRIFRHTPAFQGVNLFAGSHDDAPRRVEWLSGACLLVRREAIEAAGGLDESWFMYAEDMEWCDRIGRAGYTLHHLPEAQVEHLAGASAPEGTVSTVYIESLRSYFIRREDPSAAKLLAFDFVVVSGLLLRAALYGLRALTDRPRRRMWAGEMQKFAGYAGALAGLRRRPRLAPARAGK